MNNRQLKIALLVTTYKRNEQLKDLLLNFTDYRFKVISSNLEVLVIDDDPDSELEKYIDEVIQKSSVNIIYKKNRTNLGQGPNSVNALKQFRDYDYYWISGDDDKIIIEEVVSFVINFIKVKPSVGFVEFRQGENLKDGTFFHGPSREIENITECIENIRNFGKGASCIFAKPSDWAMRVVEEKFGDCMYQDKAWAIFSLLESRKRNAYLKTEITIYGDEGYGVLRYSMRVFVNLERTINLAIKIYNEKYGDSVASLPGPQLSALWWWCIGIKSHFNPKSSIRYTNERLLKELFIVPVGYIFKRALGKTEYFEKN